MCTYHLQPNTWLATALNLDQLESGTPSGCKESTIVAMFRTYGVSFIVWIGRHQSELGGGVLSEVHGHLREVVMPRPVHYVRGMALPLGTLHLVHMDGGLEEVGYGEDFNFTPPCHVSVHVPGLYILLNAVLVRKMTG